MLSTCFPQHVEKLSKNARKNCRCCREKIPPPPSRNGIPLGKTDVPRLWKTSVFRQKNLPFAGFLSGCGKTVRFGLWTDCGKKTHFSKKRKTVPYRHRFSYELALYLVENLLAIVETALLANAVSEIHLTAVGALSHCGSFKLPNARASGVSASLRCFCLWYCHFATS